LTIVVLIALLGIFILCVFIIWALKLLWSCKKEEKQILLINIFTKNANWFMYGYYATVLLMQIWKYWFISREIAYLPCIESLLTFSYITNLNLWCKMANKRCPQNQIQKKFHFESQFTQFSSSYSFMQRLRMQWKSGTDTDRKEIISLLWGCYLISGNSIDFIIFLSYLFDNTTHTHALMFAVRPIKYAEYCHWNEGTKQSWKKLWNVFLCLKVADISLKLDLSHSLGWQQHFFLFSCCRRMKN